MTPTLLSQLGPLTAAAVEPVADFPVLLVVKPVPGPRTALYGAWVRA
ncbi:hypothetical protein [Sphaerisporangium aureirubrum]|uniref:Uncharacterized protein n=1 Tax=Sphaerisporangium aureirubrum TaxID=1544736 RepID=A0ABW1NI05_9ACTN